MARTAAKKKTHADILRAEAEIERKSQIKQARIKAAIDRETMIDAAHLLNKLRLEREADDNPISSHEEEQFWAFMALLKAEDRDSVIN